jgi:hypothetical protein
MSPRLLALLVPLVLLAPLAPAESPGEYAPRAVVAVSLSAEDAAVAWVPGSVPADAHRVYGLEPSGAAIFLLDTASTETGGAVATVPGGFTRYAVSGIVAGTESPRVLSFAIPPSSCTGYVEVDIDPPSVAVCGPLPTLPIEVRDLPLV